ncbi:MAG: UDP-N-acetylmuramoyl-L-alanine--D-glutamate ligase [Candidatus Pacebacteria bacterium]|nr:UDP-N-acetylmuramoyl-L-alanine--D-glutamate ligase [Candidatus Paceibacterota bacterium]
MFTKELSKLNNKTILILGMAREGLSTAEFLLSHLKEINLLVTDTKPLKELDPTWSSLLEHNKNVKKIETNKVQDSAFDFVFKTPGISEIVLKEKYQLDVPPEKLQSNTQLFFDLIESLENQPITIGITGTKGKSTTTSQIFHVLKHAQVDVALGGNIGVPPLRLLENNDQPNERTYVLEMSCHQLAELTTSPQIAIIQDISSDHLDFYPNFETYFEAKTAICKFQLESSIVIYNSDSDTATKMAKLSQGEHLPFSLKDSDQESQEIIKLIKKSPSSLVGVHNLYNTIPAVIVARILDISDDEISKGVASFKSVPHRIELVKTVDEVKFYNDSAASAPEATIAALKAFENKPIILITGGSEKGANFDKLAQIIIDHNVKYLVLFPTTGEKILNSVKKLDSNHPLVNNNKTAHDMSEAVTISKEQAQVGDIVLMSPASASFNMFKNYEDRGNQFRELAQSL